MSPSAGTVGSVPVPLAPRSRRERIPAPASRSSVASAPAPMKARPPCRSCDADSRRGVGDGDGSAAASATGASSSTGAGPSGSSQSGEPDAWSTARMTWVSSRFAAVPRLPSATPVIRASALGFVFECLRVTRTAYYSRRCVRSARSRKWGYRPVTTAAPDRGLMAPSARASRGSGRPRRRCRRLPRDPAGPSAERPCTSPAARMDPRSPARQGSGLGQGA